MTSRQYLTPDRLRSVVDYDPATGVFRWKVTKRANAQAGSVAGCQNDRGYWVIQIDRKIHLAHRLAFLFVTGKHPKAVVDHINGSKSDNRWQNLRECSRSENMWNQRTHSNNKCGFKGVCYHKLTGKWSAQIRVNGKRLHLGLSTTPEGAAALYAAAARLHHREFAGPR